MVDGAWQGVSYTVLRKFVLFPSCVNVVLPTSVNVVNATVLVQFQIL